MGKNVSAVKYKAEFYVFMLSWPQGLLFVRYKHHRESKKLQKGEKLSHILQWKQTTGKQVEMLYLTTYNKISE